MVARCVTAVVIVAGLVLNAVNLGANAGLSAPIGHDIVFSLWALAYASVGALITLRRPGNVVGWLLLAAGFVFALGSLSFEWANFALGARSAPGGELALLAANTGPTAALSLIPLALLLFPDGRLPSPRWRPVAWLMLASVAFLVLGYGMAPGRVDAAVAADNPIGIGAAGSLLVGFVVLGWSLTAVGFAAAGVATVGRLRRSRGTLRQQMKWVTYAAALMGVIWAQWCVTFLFSIPRVATDLELALTTAAMAGIPIAMGIAILRDRLYEIDVIIRKTIVYTLLVVVLFTVYAGGVFVLSLALRSVAGGSGALVVTLSTLAVAAAFQPLRRRIQHAVEHRFYRDKYDATDTLEAFTSRMREHIDIDALNNEMLAVVTETLQPTHATLWLRPTKHTG
jgi:hypothetical protein